MLPLNTEWIAKNEYTCPLKGSPDYRRSGIIYALDDDGGRFAVSRIHYERFDEQNFQYIFEPKWGIIDALPADVFQGIPGLDLSLRLVRYYRVNMTPVFVSERTPGEGREDLWELLEAVGMDYYDRFEWLLRTKMRCGTDNLIVEAANTSCKKIYWNSSAELNESTALQPDDCIFIDSLDTLASSNRKLRSSLIQILGSGAHVELEMEKQMLSEAECSAMLRLLLIQKTLDEKVYRENRNAGIQRAKAAGKYSGRKRIEIDGKLLEEVISDFREQKITEKEAMERLGISSRSTFYRRLRERKDGVNSSK